ncbi:MAG: DUF6678 family protein [Verrucomicrobiota bacterium]
MFAGWQNIEWLDVRAVRAFPRGALVEPGIKDNTTQLIQAIREAGVPFSRQEGCIRIWGYVRSGISPRWEE